MPSLIFVRHGEAVANVNRLVAGWLDTPLTPTGVQQAHAAASTLVGVGVERVIASDLTRAAHTGRIIAEALGVRLELDPALREQHFGALEGQPAASLQPIASDAVHAERWGGGESLIDVAARLTPLLGRLRPTGSVVLVSHAHTIRVGAALLSGTDLAEIDWFPLPPGAIWKSDAIFEPAHEHGDVRGG